MWDNIKVFEDAKDHVKKYVFAKSDIVVESVLYRYPTYQERTVLCISTMCGCPMGCRFCGTGDYFVRSLSEEEIVGQAEYLLDTQIGINPNEINKLQIMFMSMGDPMLNKKGMINAIKILHMRYPKAALLISTSGPDVDYSWVREVSQKIPTVGLQFSVHESTDEARDALIPFEKKLTLKQIAEEGEKWYNATGRKPFFNYCAHEKNTSDVDSFRLLRLFSPHIWEATVSVICERDNNQMEKSNEWQRSLAQGFANNLVDNGFNVRVFDPAGQDTIGGGCGQLLFYQDWIKNNPNAKPSIGCGKPIKHIPIKEIV